ncbi:Hypothetical protein FKW44_017551 [Caligus rogercresseyi]|uniref:Uncharacterized protein n=1 Tax=Caligus rogercresseyi TaxID=217165 RepID=A0A7T8GT73_CALRO|nr:Hypothetical protein FKW44_017551 [Caligus rogercresseyi]
MDSRVPPSTVMRYGVLTLGQWTLGSRQGTVMGYGVSNPRPKDVRVRQAQ